MSREGRKAQRRDRYWRAVYKLMRKYVSRRYKLEADICREHGACIVAANHVTALDRLFVSMSFPDRFPQFAAWAGNKAGSFSAKILNLLCSSGELNGRMGEAALTKSCMHALRDGGIIAVFPEGDATWNGLGGGTSAELSKLLRASGAKLITYRLEGAYFSLPRWAKRPRKGKIRGHIVGVYEAEMLKSMTEGEISAIIASDIYEDAWARQREENISYACKNSAEGIEKALFLCPKCGCIDTLKSKGDKISCTCGMKLKLSADGNIEPAEPFENLLQWDEWQRLRLENGKFRHGEYLFSDNNIRLRRISAGSHARVLCSGRLVQYEDRLDIEGRVFRLREIKSMSMAENDAITFIVDRDCYELGTKENRCLRKYLMVWENLQRER